MADDKDIINLASWRAKKGPQDNTSTTTFSAVGQDRIVLIHCVGDKEIARHEFAGENIRLLERILDRAALDARMWGEPGCPACDTKRCRKWHDGLLLERRENGAVRRYWVDGVTASGRHRLRAMDGGKARYTRAWSPRCWGKIVGYRAVIAP